MPQVLLTLVSLVSLVTNSDNQFIAMFLIRFNIFDNKF